MDINRQAALFTRKELLIHAQPHTVWNIHTGIDAWSRWQPGIALSKLEGALRVGSVFQWKTGGLTITSTIEVVEPEERIGWTGRSLGTQAKHIWTFRPHQSGTLVTTEESMDGWFVRILKIVMPTFLDTSLDLWLQSLKKQAEDNRMKT
jgi:hypothetical protein